MSRSITDRPIYTIVRYLYYFFLTNFYFIVCNLLFFIVFYLADFVFENILLFYITLIPMGPTITAVLSSMGKLVREKDLHPTKDFFIAYKTNFIRSKYWIVWRWFWYFCPLFWYFCQLFRYSYHLHGGRWKSKKLAWK